MDEENEKPQDYQKAIRSVVQHLKCKRLELQNDINCEEKEKAYLTCEMNKIKDRLSVLNVNLKKKAEFRNEYDKAISQSEEHFEELLKKSEDFLAKTRREALALSHAVCDVPSTCPCASDKNLPDDLLLSSSCVPQPNANATVQNPKSPDCYGCTPISTGMPNAALVIPYKAKANGL